MQLYTNNNLLTNLPLKTEILVPQNHFQLKLCCFVNTPGNVILHS